MSLLFQFQNAQTTPVEISAVAFYNLENLFDTQDDPHKNDNDFLPTGKYHWTEEQYHFKSHQMAAVISQLGGTGNLYPPDVVGVAEIENDDVLRSLTEDSALKPLGYGFIHEESPDQRGVDVGLLYRREAFVPEDIKSRKLYLKNEKNKPVRTRDQLIVTGLLRGEAFAFIVSHWPSRIGGVKRSNPLREAAAAVNKIIFDSLLKLTPDLKIISMGDFNDNPSDPSFKAVLKTLPTPATDVSGKSLYNPMEERYKHGDWTLIYQNKPFFFDQIFFNGNLLSGDNTSYKFLKAGVFNKPFLISQEGKYKGYPKRSFVNNAYTKGYSDHLPVYVQLVRGRPSALNPK